MIIRTFNPDDLRNGTDLYREFVPGDFDFKGWVENEDNIILKDEDSIGFITFEYPGVYSAHHFHKSRRGRDALRCTLEMLKYAFDRYPIQALRGLTKTKLKHACWMARQCGMKSYGIHDTHDEPHELFIMTRDEFYEHYNKRMK